MKVALVVLLAFLAAAAGASAGLLHITLASLKISMRIKLPSRVRVLAIAASSLHTGTK